MEDAESKKDDPPWWRRTKDTVDIVSKLATIAIAIVGFELTQAYNDRQALDQKNTRIQQDDLQTQQRDLQQHQVRLQEIQAVTPLFGPLTSHNSKTRHLAVITIGVLTSNDSFAIRLCQTAMSAAECSEPISHLDQAQLITLDTSKSAIGLKATARRALDRIQGAEGDTLAVRPITARAVVRPSSVTDTAGRRASERQGWVYLGLYQGDSRTWQTRYFDFPSTMDTAALKPGTQLVVRRETGALNVRRGIFFETGYQDIVDVLKPGSRVTVQRVSSWNNTAFIWAFVSYLRQ